MTDREIYEERVHRDSNRLFKSAQVALRRGETESAKKFLSDLGDDYLVKAIAACDKSPEFKDGELHKMAVSILDERSKRKL